MKKSKFKTILGKIKPYAMPGIITCLVMVVILILKGIWPFGNERIDYFDNMQQGCTFICAFMGLDAWKSIVVV